MLKIHHTPRARGLRVVWQCEEMGLPYEIALVAFPLSEEYRALNPAGAVPYLEDGDVGMNESIAMMLYIAERYGPTPIWPQPADKDFPKALQFLIYGEATLGMWGNAVMITRFFAPEDQKENFTAAAARERMFKGFAYVADKLGASPFIAGDRFTLADISIAYVIGMARAFLKGDDELAPALLAYHDRLQQRPAYQRAIAVK